MSPSELKNHIDRRRFAAVYYLYGVEDFLIERDMRTLADAAIGDGDRSFNYTVFYGTECSAAEVVSTANAFPFMAEKRVVVVRNAVKLLSEPALAAYVQNPSPDTVLILTAETLPRSAKKKSDGKKSGPAFDIVAYLKDPKNAFKADVTLEYKELKEPGAADIVRQELARLGHDASAGAIGVLLALKGLHTRTLVGECEKLHAAVAGRRVVTESDVLTFVGASPSSNMFAVWDRLCERNLPAAEKTALGYLETGSATALIGYLAKQYSMIWQIPLNSGNTNDEAEARALGINSTYYYQQLKKVRGSVKNDFEFEKIFGYLLAADLELKSRGSEKSALERMVIPRLLYQIIVESRHV